MNRNPDAGRGRSVSLVGATALATPSSQPSPVASSPKRDADGFPFTPKTPSMPHFADVVAGKKAEIIRDFNNGLQRIEKKIDDSSASREGAAATASAEVATPNPLQSAAKRRPSRPQFVNLNVFPPLQIADEEAWTDWLQAAGITSKSEFIEHFSPPVYEGTRMWCDPGAVYKKVVSLQNSMSDRVKGRYSLYDEDL